MNNQMSSYNNPEWHERPHASYPQPPQPASYYPQPQQQMQSYPNQPAMPQQQPYYPNQNPYAAPQPGPYQMPQLNVNINNVQNGYVAEPLDPYSRAAITARTMGIVAVTVWILPFVGSLASLICAIIGFIMSIKGLKSVNRHGSAVAGMILSLIALVFIVGWTILFGTYIMELLMHQQPQP